MIKDYAPKGENNTAKYLQFLRKRTGVTDNKKVKNFTPEEFEKLWKTIELMEGAHKGKITECTEKLKITGIKRDKKKTIIAYFIQSIGWVSKAEGINLTRQEKVDAMG